jgi:phospholipid transport system substrate-binding protein
MVCLRGGLIALAAVAVLSVPRAAWTQDQDAARVVDDLHGALLSVMKEADALGYAGREERLTPVVGSCYDVAFMGRKSLGRHWKSLEAGQQEQFLAAFGKVTVANYAGRFDGWSGQVFEMLGAEPGVRDTRIVKTRLLQPEDEDVQLDYRLHQTGAGWRVIDVYVNGTISELALRRSEYSALLEREGFEALMSAIDAKIGRLERGES